MPPPGTGGWRRREPERGRGARVTGLRSEARECYSSRPRWTAGVRGGVSIGSGSFVLINYLLQRGLQRFFGQILIVYSRFCSVSFALWHSLKTVFPRVPCLSVAVYVVRKIVTTKETFRMDSEVLCSLLAFRLCISPFVPIDLHLLFWYCIVCKTPIKH